MPKRNRVTLKNFFKQGALPNEGHFADFIDSTVNVVDEGFEKTKEDGLKLLSTDDHQTWMSLYRTRDPNQAQWILKHDDRQNSFLIHAGQYTKDQAPIVSLTGQKAKDHSQMAPRVGINTHDPSQTLDVNGVVKSKGRMGHQPYVEETVLADGRWHDITGPLNGCQSFEVMAGAGKKDSGRYALMRAIAMNAFNPTGFWRNFFSKKTPIRYQHAYYDSIGHKLQLRWITKSKHTASNPHPDYYLQIRTRSSYGEGIRIIYHLTQLWFDPLMQASWQKPDDVQ